MEKDPLREINGPNSGTGTNIKDSVELLGELGDVECAAEDQADGVVEHIESVHGRSAF